MSKDISFLYYVTFNMYIIILQRNKPRLWHQKIYEIKMFFKKHLINTL